MDMRFFSLPPCEYLLTVMLYKVLSYEINEFCPNIQE